MVATSFMERLEGARARRYLARATPRGQQAPAHERPPAPSTRACGREQLDPRGGARHEPEPEHTDQGPARARGRRRRPAPDPKLQGHRIHRRRLAVARPRPAGPVDPGQGGGGSPPAARRARGAGGDRGDADGGGDGAAARVARIRGAAAGDRGPPDRRAADPGATRSDRGPARLRDRRCRRGRPALRDRVRTPWPRKRRARRARGTPAGRGDHLGRAEGCEMGDEPEPRQPRGHAPVVAGRAGPAPAAAHDPLRIDDADARVDAAHGLHRHRPGAPVFGQAGRPRHPVPEGGAAAASDGFGILRLRGVPLSAAAKPMATLFARYLAP